MLEAEVARRQLSQLEGGGVGIQQPRICFYSHLCHRFPQNYKQVNPHSPKSCYHLIHSIYLMRYMYLSQYIAH